MAIDMERIHYNKAAGSGVMAKKQLAYVVIESCEDYEQVLAVDSSNDKPNGGILVWAEGKFIRTVFASRKDASDAIKRTEHYSLAFGRSDLPEAKFCHVVPVRGIHPMVKP